MVRRTKHNRLKLPRLDGSKAQKRKYNHQYWLKVTSKKKKR